MLFSIWGRHYPLLASLLGLGNLQFDAVPSPEQLSSLFPSLPLSSPLLSSLLTLTYNHAVGTFFLRGSSAGPAPKGPTGCLLLDVHMSSRSFLVWEDSS